ncbi:peptidase family C78-domain-containing protein [Aspergillus ambiguus]|uniref:C78 family peptidase n=1 Tax=Aspergillus ambiguus TaxID=176160 RepID=UPI003CCE043F
MSDQRSHDPTCPFCPFSDPDSNFVAEHVEYCHPEHDTQLDIGGRLAAHSPTSENDQDESLPKYIDCPHGCGETVESTELSTHLDLHLAESVALEDVSVPQTPLAYPASDAGYISEPEERMMAKNLSKSSTGQRLAKDDSIRTFLAKGSKSTRLSPTTTDPRATRKGGVVKQLGRAELGPYAHEKKMPSWLRRMLEKGANSTLSNRIAADGSLQKHEIIENETTGIIPVLARLCEHDKSVQRAFLCSPEVHQISKMPREGGFCGYRNIQMLVSYIRASRSPGYEYFRESLPTILQLQDMIENAWDMGYNSVGRVETGGIRGTRKYIGTPEAQALFMSLEIQCEASSIAKTNETPAHDSLFANIAAYFRQTCSMDRDSKVITTELPPIYLQHQGHSLTIVGFEIRDNGSANLLVFDPMFRPPNAVIRLIGTRTVPPDPSRVLKGYRRGVAYLQKYKLFELLKLSAPPDPVERQLETSGNVQERWE